MVIGRQSQHRITKKITHVIIHHDRNYTCIISETHRIPKRVTTSISKSPGRERARETVAVRPSLSDSYEVITFAV